MPELQREGVSLHYEDQGSGAPLVLVAGIASDSSSWGPLTEPLAQEFRVLRPDNRGTGRTLPKLPDCSIEASAEDILVLIAEVGGRAHLVGHSMGGLIAMEAAARAPAAVQSLTLLANAPLWSGRNQHLLETLVQLRAEGMPEGLWLRAFYPWLLRGQMFQVRGLVDVALRAALAYPHAQDAAQFAAQVAAVAGYDPVPRAREVKVPVQAVLGADDLLYPAAQTREALAAAFSGCPVTVLEGAAHSLHWDRPADVAAAIISFAKTRG